ncbi:twin-arginine translocation protein TatB [Hahella chejuensis KCTC 2396]|uniref:Sec-independent protein translocase protein TatB n=1 Tax=Hahella chejuensis (strain KCTC 2396) TaxID=349521 RepID=TATB_HAHCH|nr:Sec-independent protein translocase protein TatB [Hahella chejuensis]Q2SN18.1 RecName: Full=Sec-independent protein translocase protein TatB [Hahella chejuensis KCTC 2396]ABC27956.1 twin-arginine translocation protein TatB [Hahella chejuensis KCTC 2396]
MFDIGFPELALVAVIGLLVLGPERLPYAARKTGLWVGRIRRMVSQMSSEIDRQLKAEEMRERLRKEGDTLGLEKIQQTVNEALAEAKKYEDMVEKNPATPMSSKASTPQTPSSGPDPQPVESHSHSDDASKQHDRS